MIMREVSVFNLVSIDGYFATVNGNIYELKWRAKNN